MPESLLPVIETIRTIRQQIYFQQNSHIDEIHIITSFIGDITHIPQIIINLPVHINILHLFKSPKIKQDKELEEFLRGERSEENTTETLPIETPENIPIQKQYIDLQQLSVVDVIYDRNCSTNPVAPIQPVEPVIGLTPEEQQKKEADPNLTLTELLGLTSCEGHINTPLQTLDGLYVNQPSRFLPLAHEA